VARYERPEIDGKLLYDIIIRNKYTKALEIGTSTGHSSIWIAGRQQNRREIDNSGN